ncbi:MAG: tRNA (adenosine(37)-N6)-threonylcarbamoyltransferase complex transferase subunit TsaD [Candidatus Gastranaerophilales bacterium]|nr:tRNA (adenosine(37)-N6)-threonylcarbamoyltransferase complex transferase subunit TsaD [Candidatus Gastranaerophilales bacterium]
MSKQLKTPFNNQIKKIGYGNNNDQFILAIETSCDETAASVVKNGRKVISNIVASQIPTHQKYGGVVPEVAAREHLESINMVIEAAFKEAAILPEKIDAFSATVGPGLVGCLLVGLNAAKTLSLVYNKPFIGINHLNAHVCANYLDTDLEPPFICLLVSGGHTQIIKITSYGDQEILGETIDDAVGEAYDKVARLIGIPYPGGPNLDKLAPTGDKKRFQFPKARVDGYNFSFSGLKTAVLRTIQTFNKDNIPKADIAASFQETVGSTLLKKTLQAAEDNNIKTIAIAGGVAANSEIRKKIFDLQNNGYKVYAPAMKYCTDNAAMVASAAYFMSNVMTDLEVEVFSRI